MGAAAVHFIWRSSVSAHKAATGHRGRMRCESSWSPPCLLQLHSHCTALRCNAPSYPGRVDVVWTAAHLEQTGGEEGEEGREGKEGREGREGREGDMSACRHVACRMSSSRRLLDRGENRVAIAATWTLQICACSPVRDPSGFRRARAQRCRPLSTTDGAPPAPPAPVKLQPKPPKQPSHPSRSLFPADTSTVENTARQPDSPSARIQRPVCQFARLALSGMPCFFPARFHVWAPLGLPSSGHPGRERGRGSVSMSAPVEYRLEIAPETGKHDLGLDRGQRTGSSFRVQQGQVGKWANERRLRDDYHSVSRALSTNGDRDLHTEGWAMLARLRQSGSDRRHATCSDCGAGCRPRDGWDFSRCNPGSLATRVGVPSPVRSTLYIAHCTLHIAHCPRHCTVFQTAARMLWSMESMECFVEQQHLKCHVANASRRLHPALRASSASSGLAVEMSSFMDSS